MGLLIMNVNREEDILECMSCREDYEAGDGGRL